MVVAELSWLMLMSNCKKITKIYKEYAEELKRFASSRFSSKEDSEDVVHDIFLKLLDKTHLLECCERIGGYLIQATKYESLSLKRKQRVQVASEFIAELPDERPTLIAEKVELESLSFSLAVAIADLPQGKARSTVESFYLEEKSCEFIAKDLGISVNTVLSHLHRFRRRAGKLIAAANAKSKTAPFGEF